MRSEEEISEIEHFCHEAVKHFGLVLVCDSGSRRCKVSKRLDNGSWVDCWFTWALSATQSDKLSYPAIFSSTHEDLFPLLLGTDSSRGFFIRRFFWEVKDRNYSYSTKNPFLGCKSVYEAKIRLDLVKE